MHFNIAIFGPVGGDFPVRAERGKEASDNTQLLVPLDSSELQIVFKVQSQIFFYLKMAVILKLMSNDGKVFNVEFNVTLQTKVLKAMLEDTGDIFFFFFLLSTQPTRQKGRRQQSIQ